MRVWCRKSMINYNPHRSESTCEKMWPDQVLKAWIESRWCHEWRPASESTSASHKGVKSRKLKNQESNARNQAPKAGRKPASIHLSTKIKRNGGKLDGLAPLKEKWLTAESPMWTELTHTQYWNLSSALHALKNTKTLKQKKERKILGKRHMETSPPSPSSSNIHEIYIYIHTNININMNTNINTS